MTPSEELGSDKKSLPGADETQQEKTMEDRIRQLGIETDSSFVIELLDSYPPLFQKHFANIQDSFEKQDATRLHFASHTLKGASLNIGASQLASVCRKIEDFSEQKDFESIGKLLGDLKKELTSTSAALEAIRIDLSRKKT